MPGAPEERMGGASAFPAAATGATVTRALTKNEALAARRGDPGLNCILVLRLIWTRLRHQQSNQSQAASANKCKAEEGDAAAEMIHRITGKRGAQRSADAYRATNDAETEIESSRPTRDVRHDKRQNHAQGCCAHAIEKLHGNDQIGIGHECKQHAARCQGCKAEEQQRSSSPRICNPANPGSKPRDDELRHYDACA